VRAGPSARARGPHGECAGVPAHVRWGHRPPARTPCRGENALFGRGRLRKRWVRKHLEALGGPTKTVQQMFSTQRVLKHGLRAFHGRPCWTVGGPISGRFGRAVFRLTCSSLPGCGRAARPFLAAPGCFQFFGVLRGGGEDRRRMGGRDDPTFGHRAVRNGARWPARRCDDPTLGIRGFRIGARWVAGLCDGAAFEARRFRP